MTMESEFELFVGQDCTCKPEYNLVTYQASVGNTAYITMVTLRVDEVEVSSRPVQCAA
jgi:hypothetical protein